MTSTYHCAYNIEIQKRRKVTYSMLFNEKVNFSIFTQCECFLKQDYIIMLAFLNNVNIVEHLDLMLIGEQT